MRIVGTIFLSVWLALVSCPSPAHARDAHASVRTQKLTKRKPGWAVSCYPTVGLADAQAARAINASIGRLIAGLCDTDDPAPTPVDLRWRIEHNADGILSITFILKAEGAYPTGWFERRTYRISTGEELGPEQLFDPVKLPALAARLDVELQKELDLARQGRLPGVDPECKDAEYDGHFSVEHLRTFHVSSKGVTFFFPYDFSHARKPCQPRGSFALTFADLRPFVTNASPLASLVNRAAPRTSP